MKRLSCLLLDNLFGIFKFYRKRTKGTWYKVYHIDSEAGVQGPVIYWTRANIESKRVEILKKEKWG
jgi:hypothetical protein